GWGVAGVAWATVIASAIEMTLLVLAYRRDLWVLPRVRWSAVAAIWRVGLPTGGQFLLEIGAFTLLTVLISAMSEIEMAAHQLVLHLLHISFLPCHAIAESGSVLAGQAVGADRDDLVPGVARRVMILATSYMALCTAIALFGASGIIGLFTDDRELAAVAVTIMHIGTIFLLADGANMVARGILRGTGDVRYPAVVGIACAWLCTPPLTWLLGYQAGLGAAGGWIGLSLEIFASAGILWWRLTRGHWRRAAQRSRAQVLERIADPQPAQDDQRDRSETDPGAAALACSSGSSA
ncbi:MAG: MATE family efflux transporter, partial [Myxococcota bacterium]